MAFSTAQPPTMLSTIFEQLAWLVSTPYRVLNAILKVILNLFNLVFEVISLVDAYMLNLVTSIVNHYRKKLMGIVMELSLMPYNLALSAVEMICFTLFVAAPAYLNARKQYRTDAPFIEKNVRYGARPGQVLDIYTLEDRSLLEGTAAQQALSPVVIFIQGGGWTICQKQMYPAVGRAFRLKGVVTVIPEYTAFPQGDVSVMLDDVKTAIAWTLSNIDKYGGNPSKVYLVGVSAGAHLSCLALLTEVETYLKANAVLNSSSQEMNKSKSAPSFSTIHETHWTYSGIKAYIGISGPYNVPDLFKNMVNEGKEKFSGLNDIMRGKENFEKNSPFHILQRIAATYRGTDISRTLPQVALIHASRDKTCPLPSAVEFDRALRQAGVSGKLTIYEGQSHLESIMEVLEGDDNTRLMADITKVIQSGGSAVEVSEVKPSWSWRFRRMVMRTLSPV